MSRMEQTADDVILDLLVDGVEPTYDNLAAAIAVHPEHKEALEAFFATLAMQSALGPEAASAGVDVERFANIGVSRVLASRHKTPDLEPASRAAPAYPNRLSRMLRDRGLGEDAVGARVGLDERLLMKLDCRRIRGPRPLEVFKRLSAELDIPPAHVIAAATGQPIATSRGNLRKAKGPIRVETETFEEAIQGSSLTNEIKAYWLALMADESAPKV